MTAIVIVVNGNYVVKAKDRYILTRHRDCASVFPSHDEAEFQAKHLRIASYEIKEIEVKE